MLSLIVNLRSPFQYSGLQRSIVVWCAFLTTFISLSALSRAQSASTQFKLLEARDNEATHYTVAWELKETTVRESKDPSLVQKHLKEQLQAARSYALEAKIVDENAIQKEVENRQELVKMMAAGGAFIRKSRYVFTRNKDITHVTGSWTEAQSKIERKCHEYYGMNWAMYFDEYNRAEAGTEIQGTAPIVLGTKGSALSAMVGLYSQLKVFPEDFAALIATNPLRLHNQEWKQSQVLPNDNIVYQAVYRYSGMDNRCRVTLDPKLDYAPVDIEISNSSTVRRYKLENYAKRNKLWLPARVNYRYNSGSAIITREWKLAEVSGSEPIVIDNLKGRTGVADLRLKGNNLDIAEITKGLSGHDTDLVAYAWQGTVPTLGELRLLKAKQDEVRPPTDLNPLQKYWMFIPGVILIATGVFLKLRKPSLGKKGKNIGSA